MSDNTNNNNSSSEITDSPTDPAFWDTPNGKQFWMGWRMESDKDDECIISLAFPSALLSSTGQATAALMTSLLASSANQSASLPAQQSCSPGSVEEDDTDDDEDEVAGPATISSRGLLLLDELQQTELVNKGIETVEDKLFTILGSNTAYTYMNLLNDSANNPRSSYLATLPESHYYNNLEIGGQKLADLKQTIKNESFFIERNFCSLDDANQALVEATRARDAKKAEYEAAERFVENAKARRDGYSSAAENTRKLKQEHELDQRVLEILKDAMEHVVHASQTSPGEMLPYGNFSMDTLGEMAKLFGLSDYSSVLYLVDKDHSFLLPVH
jgi:hypothetical protein